MLYESEVAAPRLTRSKSRANFAPGLQNISEINNYQEFIFANRAMTYDRVRSAPSRDFVISGREFSLITKFRIGI